MTRRVLLGPLSMTALTTPVSPPHLHRNLINSFCRDPDTCSPWERGWRRGRGQTPPMQGNVIEIVGRERERGERYREAEIHRETKTERDQDKDAVRDGVVQTGKGVGDSGQEELERREDHQRSGLQSGEEVGSSGVFFETKEWDRELGNHRRMKGWGRARDNSTIVWGRGAGPMGQETGPLPLHRGGPWPGQGSWQCFRRNRC